MPDDLTPIPVPDAPAAPVPPSPPADPRPEELRAMDAGALQSFEVCSRRETHYQHWSQLVAGTAEPRAFLQFDRDHVHGWTCRYRIRGGALTGRTGPGFVRLIGVFAARLPGGAMVTMVCRARLRSHTGQTLGGFEIQEQFAGAPVSEVLAEIRADAMIRHGLAVPPAPAASAQLHDIDRVFADARRRFATDAAKALKPRIAIARKPELESTSRTLWDWRGGSNPESASGAETSFVRWAMEPDSARLFPTLAVTENPASIHPQSWLQSVHRTDPDTDARRIVEEGARRAALLYVARAARDLVERMQHPGATWHDSPQCALCHRTEDRRAIGGSIPPNEACINPHNATSRYSAPQAEPPPPRVVMVCSACYANASGANMLRGCDRCGRRCTSNAMFQAGNVHETRCGHCARRPYDNDPDARWTWEPGRGYRAARAVFPGARPSSNVRAGYHSDPVRRAWRRPRPMRPGATAQAVGIELEIEVPETAHAQASAMVRAAHWAYERDGSLHPSRGVELVSPPLPYDAGADWLDLRPVRESLRAVLAALPPDAEAWTAGRGYGLHVNLSVGGWTSKRCNAFCSLFCVNAAQRQFFESLAGREESNWSRYHSAKGARYDKYAAAGIKEGVSDSRAEIRIFRSTLREESLIGAIAFCVDAERFTLATDGAEDNAGAFLAWLEENASAETRGLLAIRRAVPNLRPLAASWRTSPAPTTPARPRQNATPSYSERDPIPEPAPAWTDDLPPLACLAERPPHADLVRPSIDLSRRLDLNAPPAPEPEPDEEPEERSEYYERDDEDHDDD